MIATSEMCKAHVNEIVEFLILELKSMTGPLTVSAVQQRFNEAISQYVTKQDEALFCVDVGVREQTWGDLYPDIKECLQKMRRAWWLRLLRRPVPFKTPRGLHVYVTVMPRLQIKAIVGGFTFRPEVS